MVVCVFLTPATDCREHICCLGRAPDVAPKYQSLAERWLRTQPRIETGWLAAQFLEGLLETGWLGLEVGF